MERAAHRQPDRALGAARLARVIAASTAAISPEITTWPGALKFAGTTTPASAARGARRLDLRASSPRIAAIVPGVRAPPRPSARRAAHQRAARPRTRASRRRRAPSTRRGCARRRTTARVRAASTAASAATLWASSAGCAFTVFLSRRSGPFPAQVAEREAERAVGRRERVSRASGSASASAWPMPTFCAPWPGNRNASFIVTPPPAPRRSLIVPPSRRGGSGTRRSGVHVTAPRPTSRRRRRRRDRSRSPGLMRPARTHLVEQDGHRGRRRVAVAVDVHEHPSRAIAEPLAHRVDDARFAWCGNARGRARRGSSRPRPSASRDARLPSPRTANLNSSLPLHRMKCSRAATVSCAGRACASRRPESRACRPSRRRCACRPRGSPRRRLARPAAPPRRRRRRTARRCCDRCSR